MFVVSRNAQLKELNENPLMLMLDPRFDENAKDLPISIYISQFDADDGVCDEVGKSRVALRDGLVYFVDFAERERKVGKNSVQNRYYRSRKIHHQQRFQYGTK